MKPYYPKTALSLLLALSGLLMLLSPIAQAELCSVSVTPLNFGNYDAFNHSTTDSAASITISCNASAAALVCYTLKINLKANNPAPHRQMSKDQHQLDYNLYLDNNRTLLWGDGNQGSHYISDSLVTDSLAPTSKTYTVYARMPALQDEEGGHYFDTPQIVLDYELRSLSSTCQ